MRVLCDSSFVEAAVVMQDDKKTRGLRDVYLGQCCVCVYFSLQPTALTHIVQ